MSKKRKKKGIYKIAGNSKHNVKKDRQKTGGE